MTKLAGLCMGNRVRGEGMENLLSSTDRGTRFVTQLAGPRMGNRVRGKGMENLLSNTDIIGELELKRSDICNTAIFGEIFSVNGEPAEKYTGCDYVMG